MGVWFFSNGVHGNAPPTHTHHTTPQRTPSSEPALPTRACVSLLDIRGGRRLSRGDVIVPTGSKSPREVANQTTGLTANTKPSMRFCTGAAEVWTTSRSKTAARICRAASGGISGAISAGGSGADPRLAAGSAASMTQDFARPWFPSVLYVYKRRARARGARHPTVDMGVKGETSQSRRWRCWHRFIGMWQQESGQRPRRENGATVRCTSLNPSYPLPLGHCWDGQTRWHRTTLMLQYRTNVNNIVRGPCP